MNIFEKLSKITEELGVVAKNLNVGVGKSSYKAVGEADVLAAVKPLEAKYKVYSYPISRKIVESGILETETTDYQGNKVVKKQLYERIETTYRFVNMEKVDEFIDIVSYGDGIDPQDKSVGKAMTYADKYALLKAYKIITGDDPDQKASDGTIKDTSHLDQAVLKKLNDEFRYTTDRIEAVYKKGLAEITNYDLNRLYQKLVERKAEREKQANGSEIQ